MPLVAVSVGSNLDREHNIDRALESLRLSFGQLEQYGQAERIDQSMYLGGQAAARATHATGSAIFFWALAACWWTRIEELSII